MSYEKPDFNPLDPKEDAFPIISFTQDDVGVYIVDPDVLSRKSLQEEVQLVDAELPIAGRGVSMAASIRPGKNHKGEDARLFEGTISMLPGHLNPAELGEQFSRKYDSNMMSWEDKHFPGHYMFNSPRNSYYDTRDYANPEYQVEQYLDLILTANPKANTVSLANHAVLSSQIETPLRPKYRDSRLDTRDDDEDDDDDDRDYDGKSRPMHQRTLEAPAAELFAPGKPMNKQLIFYVRGLVIAGLAAHLHNSTMRDTAIGDLIITPDGPLYFNAERGSFVHRLGRAVTTLQEKTPVAEQSEKPGYTKPAAFEKPDPHSTFSEMYGIEDIKTTLKKIAHFYRHPDKAARWRVSRPSGVVLEGPTGTGKTSLAHALANEIDADIREVKGDQIYNMYYGESERRLTAIFKEAREAQSPVVFLFDEFDGLISSGNSGPTQSQLLRSLAGIFKKEIIAISKSNPNVLFVATTNDADSIDPALIRPGRFDIRLKVGLPNEAARLALFTGIITEKIGADLVTGFEDHFPSLPDQPHDQTVFDQSVVDPSALAQLAAATEGKAGADIRSIIDEVLSDKLDQDISGLEVGLVTADDLLQKIQQMSRR